MNAKHPSRSLPSLRAALALGCALALPAVQAQAETQIAPAYQPGTDARLDAAQSDATTTRVPATRRSTPSPTPTWPT